MILNYAAGAISLLLAISSFVPWVTIWFYSLKGIESFYGILILVIGMMGVTIAVFQHLSGQIRGRSFVFLASISLICEILYFRKVSSYGNRLNEIVNLVADVFGETIIQKLQVALGEQWVQVLAKLVQRLGLDSGVFSFDFVGGGLILAMVCSGILLVTGLILEKNKPSLLE